MHADPERPRNLPDAHTGSEEPLHVFLSPR
jgi:hypothetical protein